MSALTIAWAEDVAEAAGELGDANLLPLNDESDGKLMGGGGVREEFTVIDDL